MTQIYCTREDIEDITGVAVVAAAVDDDGSGTEDADDEARITAMIERAAVEMNHALGNQYEVSELANNVWCKHVNACLAAYYLTKRRTNGAPPSLEADVTHYREELELIRWGRDSVPDQAPSFNHLPSVSNLRPELAKLDNPIRVVEEESTGGAPSEGIQREPSHVPGNL